MNHEAAEKKRALSDPAERASVLEQVRAMLSAERRHLGLAPTQMEALDAQLQSPPMYLYEDGALEIVAPALGPEKGLALDWSDLKVRLVAEQGTSDLNAGEIVWSHDAPPA
jgi:hypothetical protein